MKHGSIFRILCLLLLSACTRPNNSGPNPPANFVEPGEHKILTTSVRTQAGSYEISFDVATYPDSSSLISNLQITTKDKLLFPLWIEGRPLCYLLGGGDLFDYKPETDQFVPLTISESQFNGTLFKVDVQTSVKILRTVNSKVTNEALCVPKTFLSNVQGAMKFVSAERDPLATSGVFETTDPQKSLPHLRVGPKKIAFSFVNQNTVPVVEIEMKRTQAHLDGLCAGLTGDPDSQLALNLLKPLDSPVSEVDEVIFATDLKPYRNKIQFDDISNIYLPKFGFALKGSVAAPEVLIHRSTFSHARCFSFKNLKALMSQYFKGRGFISQRPASSSMTPASDKLEFENLIIKHFHVKSAGDIEIPLAMQPELCRGEGLTVLRRSSFVYIDQLEVALKSYLRGSDKENQCRDYNYRTMTDVMCLPFSDSWKEYSLNVVDTDMGGGRLGVEAQLVNLKRGKSYFLSPEMASSVCANYAKVPDKIPADILNGVPAFELQFNKASVEPYILKTSAGAETFYCVEPDYEKMDSCLPLN